VHDFQSIGNAAGFIEHRVQLVTTSNQHNC